METITEIIKQLPPFWPRLAAVGVLLLMMGLPQANKLLKGAATGSKRLARAKELLQTRKLQIDIDTLRAANPDLPDSILDKQIDRLLADTVKEDTELPLSWPERLKLAGAGGLTLALLGVLVAGFSGKRVGVDLLIGAGKELLVIIPCALIASAIPARTRWVPVFYGVLLPILVVALAVTARMHE